MTLNLKVIAQIKILNHCLKLGGNYLKNPSLASIELVESELDINVLEVIRTDQSLHIAEHIPYTKMLSRRSVVIFTVVLIRDSGERRQEKMNFTQPLIINPSKSHRYS